MNVKTQVIILKIGLMVDYHATSIYTLNKN